MVLCQGLGIEGDVNCDRLSPRQVLLTCANDLERLSIAPGKLRENIVLNNLNLKAFQPGAKLTFASGAEIRLTFYCEPCKRVAHLVDSFPTLNRSRGILGVVIASGAIAVGDGVEIQPECFPALAEPPYERFLFLLGKIPQGKVITYKQILRCIGVDRSYFRVIPTYLKKAPKHYPIHRVLDSQGSIIAHVPQQQKLLETEGIELVNSSANCPKQFVSLPKYAWLRPSLFAPT